MTCESLLAKLRPKLESVGHCVIAGGAVRDLTIHRKPKDWDVFVLGQPNSSAMLSAIGDLYEFEESSDSSDPSPGHSTLSIDLEGEKVQLISSPCNTLMELLDTFDWNICLFGFDTGLVLHEKCWKGGGADLKLHTVTYPLSTLRRGFRFCDRYNLLMDKEDIRRLCSYVMANIILQEEEVAEIEEFELT
jgi:tRNA nucleotidyltransferase/poly(A) polymerase